MAYRPEGAFLQGGHAVEINSSVCQLEGGIFIQPNPPLPPKGGPWVVLFGFAGLRVILLEHYLKNKEVVYLLVNISNSEDTCYSTESYFRDEEHREPIRSLGAYSSSGS